MNLSIETAGVLGENAARIFFQAMQESSEALRRCHFQIMPSPVLAWDNGGMERTQGAEYLSRAVTVSVAEGQTPETLSYALGREMAAHVESYVRTRYEPDAHVLVGVWRKVHVEPVSGSRCTLRGDESPKLDWAIDPATIKVGLRVAVAYSKVAVGGVDHPRYALDRLADLLRMLQHSKVEHALKGVPLLVDGVLGGLRAAGLLPAYTHELEVNGSAIVLRVKFGEGEQQRCFTITSG